MELARAANAMFKDCNPCFPEGSWHFKLAETEVVREHVKRITGQSSLGLSDTEYKTLLARMEKYDEETISFSRLCLFIAEAVHARFVKVDVEMAESERVKYRRNKHGDVVVDVPMGVDADDSGDGDESDDDDIGHTSLPFFPTTSMRRNIIRRLSVQRSMKSNLSDKHRQSIG